MVLTMRKPLTAFALVGGSLLLATFGGDQESDGSDDLSSDAMSKLEKLGLEVFSPKKDHDLDWSSLAGYEDLVEEIESTVVMSLQEGERFDDMARKTRKRYESNKPRAVLFEGPPGCGKTLTARILARRCGRPMVQVKSEKILSKWYGEATKNLSVVFDACEVSALL